MMINIDFLIAGCNTHCKHCYVNGGPSPMMPIDDILLCIERLDEMAQFLSDKPSFTLDHEPMNHPQIDKVLRAASHTEHINNYHHGMTTGVGLMNRQDKEAVVQSYLDNGYHSFGITIHGASAHHDEIVRRKGAFDTTVAAAKFLLRMGCKLNVSFMMNKYFAEDANELTKLLNDLGTEKIRLVSPIFTPHENMMMFEPHRATLKTFDSIRRYLPHWHQIEQEVTDESRQNCVSAAINRLQTMDLHKLWTAKQTELYLSLHQDCRLYVGNTGTETKCLGDLRTLDPQVLADTIGSLPGNRDYTAYYDEKDIPAAEDIFKALKALPQDLVYGDFESVLYRAFADLGVPTKKFIG